MTQAVSGRALTAEVRLWSHAIPLEICGGQSSVGTVFLRVLRFYPLSIIPPILQYSSSCTNCSYQKD